MPTTDVYVGQRLNRVSDLNRVKSVTLAKSEAEQSLDHNKSYVIDYTETLRCNPGYVAFVGVKGQHLLSLFIVETIAD